MRFSGYSFGSIRVDGVTYHHDLVIDRGSIRKRKKAASRKFGWSEPGDGHLGRMLDGEPVTDRCGRPAIKRKLPGELAQVIVPSRIRAGLAQPHLDVAVGR